MTMLSKKIRLIMIAVGAPLLIISLVLVFTLRSPELAKPCYYCGAFGGWLVAVALFFVLFDWFLNYRAKKHPETYRKETIEAKDERNIILGEKALAQANLAMFWPYNVLAFVFLISGAEWYAIVTPYGLMVINFIFLVIYRNYFSKRL
jgi:hypothetical protein